MALGLILSSSDFQITTNVTVPASNFNGGEYALAGLNSSLPSPITSSGDYHRFFAAPAADNAYGAYYVEQSVDGGLYSGSISTSKAYSLRAWVRLCGCSNGYVTTMGGGLTIMGRTNVLHSDSAAYRTYQAGYTLQFSGYNVNDTKFQDFKPGLSIGTAKTDGNFNAAFPPVQCTGPNDGGTSKAYAPETWYRIRFDMVPVGGAGVTLNAYTSSAGDVESGQEVWELVGTTFVNAADPVYMDPTDSENAMGFYSWCANNGQDLDYFAIDQFEILVQDL